MSTSLILERFRVYLTEENLKTFSVSKWREIFSREMALAKFTSTTYMLNPKYVFRSRLNEGLTEPKPKLFSTASQLWAPPFRKVKKPGRCNLAGQSVLYCSTDPVTTFFELSPKAGDVITWIQFKCLKDLPNIGVIGVEDIIRVDDNYASIFGGHLKKKTDEDRMIDDILSILFKTKSTDDKVSLNYNITNAITQIIMNKQDLKVKVDFAIAPRIMGFVYPSVETINPLGMNLVLNPSYAKEYLMPYRAYVMKIEKKHSPNHFQAVHLKRSSNNIADNLIKWENCYDDPIEYITDLI